MTSHSRHGIIKTETTTKQVERGNVKMASQKEMRQAKEDFTKATDQIKVDGYEFVGFGTEGGIFLNKDTDQYVIVKAVAKKEGYDAWEDIEAQEEKEAKALKREEKRKAKAEKAKAKKKEKEEEGE